MELLTPSEVAVRVNRPLVTVQRWCRSGLFPGAVQVGRSWGIPPAALTKFRPPAIGNPTMGPKFWTPKRRKSRAKRRKENNSA
jgi:hypothetical protein